MADSRESENSLTPPMSPSFSIKIQGSNIAENTIAHNITGPQLKDCLKKKVQSKKLPLECPYCEYQTDGNETIYKVAFTSLYSHVLSHTEIRKEAQCQLNGVGPSPPKDVIIETGDENESDSSNRFIRLASLKKTCTPKYILVLLLFVLVIFYLILAHRQQSIININITQPLKLFEKGKNSD